MCLKKAFRKLNSSNGFTLTEMLTSIIIMSLVGLMVTAGIVTAVRVYNDVTEYANAQVLLTNTLTLLNDSLIYADPDTVHTNGTKSVTFTHVQSGNVKIMADNSETGKNGICISYGDSTEKMPLVAYASNEEMYTDWEVSTSSDGKVFTISLFVKKGNEDIIKIDNCRIETINS